MATASLQQCMAMMAGPTDEHRFVALLVLPKILAQLPHLGEGPGPAEEAGGNGGGGTSPSGPCSTLSRVQAELLDRIDWAFFRRLLAGGGGTENGPDGSPAAATAIAAPTAEMRSVALAVLASLVEQSGLAAHGQLPTVVALVPYIVTAFGPVAAAAASTRHPAGGGPEGGPPPQNAQDWSALRDLAIFLCALIDAVAQCSRRPVQPTGRRAELDASETSSEEVTLLATPGLFDLLLDLLQAATTVSRTQQPLPSRPRAGRSLFLSEQCRPQTTLPTINTAKQLPRANNQHR